MSNIFLITDMDGTLLPKSKILNPADIEAINEFRKCGGSFSIASGRSLQSASQYFGDLQIDMPVILFNGGVVYDCKKKENVFAEFLHPSAYEITVDAIKMFPGIGCEIDTESMVYVVNENEAEKYHIDMSYKKNEYINTNLTQITKNGWLKILFADEPKEIERFKDYILSKTYNDVDFVTSSKTYFEMLPKGCSKGGALKKLIDTYKLNDYIIAAVGDYNNDLAMLEVADISIAPSNAVDKVKESVDFITESSCDEGCIAEAIHYIMKRFNF